MAVKIKLRKDSEDKGDQPIIPPTGGGGGVGVDPVAPPVASAPPGGGGGGSAPVAGNPLVPQPAAPGQFTFVPPNYQPFQQATGYGYDDWLAQVRDSLSMPTRGAGIFGDLGGNNMPRYAFGNREGSMMKGSGFNAGQFLAPYLAQIQPPGGTPGAPVPGVGGGQPGMPAPGAGRPQAPPLQPGLPQIPGAQPRSPLPGPPPPNGGAGGLLAPGYGQAIPNPTGIRTAYQPGTVMGQGGIRGGLLGQGAAPAAQSPMATFIAQLLAQQNMSGPGGTRGSR